MTHKIHNDEDSSLHPAPPWDEDTAPAPIQPRRTTTAKWTKNIMVPIFVSRHIEVIRAITDTSQWHLRLRKNTLQLALGRFHVILSL